MAAPSARPWAEGFDSQFFDEHDRITLEHYVLKMAFDKNYTAPVKELLESGAEVLDVGCGPGMWPMEMATEFPKSTFTGIDSDKSFPNNVFPNNSTFIAVDAHIPLPFEDGQFDYVHQRMQCPEYKKEEWKPTIKELVRVTKSGGWIELKESDMDIALAGQATQYLADNAIRVAEDAGMYTTVSKELGSLLREAGIVDVKEDVVTVPSGNWGGNIGAMFKEDMHRVFAAVKPEIGDISEEEYENKMHLMLDEVEKNKSSTTFRVAYGRKA